MNNKTINSNSVQSFWLALSTFSSIAFSILSVAILSRFLSKSDYGTYRQIVYVYSILVVIFSAGLPSVYSFFLPKFTLEQGREIVSKISKILFVGGMFVPPCDYGPWNHFGCLIKTKLAHNLLVELWF